MDPVTAAITSPLKVKQRKNRIWAEDASGQTVLDGNTRDYHPECYVAATASGTHRVAARVETGPQTYVPVLDGTGREVARVVATGRRESTLQLATGEQALVTGRGGVLFMTPFRCAVGDLSTAVAPRFAPQRYITLTVSDAVLARPDRDALVVALAWLSESKIAGLITKANM